MTSGVLSELSSTKIISNGRPLTAPSIRLISSSMLPASFLVGMIKETVGRAGACLLSSHPPASSPLLIAIVIGCTLPTHVRSPDLQQRFVERRRRIDRTDGIQTATGAFARV